jgi:SSS family solute:Na+ symporter
MKGAGYVLEAMTRGEISRNVGAALVYAVVLIYVLRSGVLGVGWTNTFQGIFMMILAWGLGLYLPYRLYGGIGPMFRQIASERPELLLAPGLEGGGERQSWGMYTSHVLVSLVGFCAWPHLFMKAFTARDERTIRRTVVLYPTFQIFLVPLMVIGFAGVLFPSAPSTPDEILPHMLMSMELPSFLVGLFCAGALAASMSSGDAILHACSSILVRDGWVTALGRKLTPHAERRGIRWVLLLPLVLAYWIAIQDQSSLVDLLLYAYGPVTQLFPAVVAALCWRRATSLGVNVGLVAGIATTVFLQVRPELRPWPIHEGVFGLAVQLGLLIGLSLLRPETDVEERDRFLAVAGGESPPE